MKNEREQILNLRIRKTPLTHPRVEQIWVKKKDLLSFQNKGLIMSEDVPLYSLRNLDPRKSLGVSTSS